MSSIPSDKLDADSLNPLDAVYYAALHFPVTDIFVSAYELYKKAEVSKKYHGEIGEQYTPLSDRYFALKSYPEICCTFVWGFGEMALLGLHYYKQSKGAELYKKAVDDPSQMMTLLKMAADQYRYIDAIYLLGTFYRDGQGVPVDAHAAITYFKEAVAQGDQRSIIALGNLYLAGLGEQLPQDIHKAAAYFHKACEGQDNTLSSFAKYRESFAHLLFELGLKRREVLDFVSKAPDRFDTDFSVTNDVVVSLGLAFNNKELPTLFNDDAEKLFRCAAAHIPADHQKAVLFYILAKSTNNWSDYEQAALHGHRQAAFELSVLKRDQAINSADPNTRDQLLQQACELLANIPTDDLQKDFYTAMLLGHYYLGFGSTVPHFDKAIECYKLALTNLPLESERFKVQFLVDFAAILQEMERKNPKPFKALHLGLKNDPSLWSYLPLEGLSPLPLLVARQLLEEGEELQVAQKLFELCVRQPEQSMKLPSLYALSTLDVAKQQDYLEQCIKLDPKHYRARMDLYSILKEVNTQQAEGYLQPAIDAQVPEALYLKALSIIAEADQSTQQKPNFGFGAGQTHETVRRGLLLRAKEFMVPAARGGYEPAQQACRSHGWNY